MFVFWLAFKINHTTLSYVYLQDHGPHVIGLASLIYYLYTGYPLNRDFLLFRVTAAVSKTYSKLAFRYIIAMTNVSISFNNNTNAPELHKAPKQRNLLPLIITILYYTLYLLLTYINNIKCIVRERRDVIIQFTAN